MNNTAVTAKKSKGVLTPPFWIVWNVEVWERFGYYGIQTILALFFVHELHLGEDLAVVTFGIFAAFIYGFVWIGGAIGDKFFGAKRTTVLGAFVMMLSYFFLSFADQHTVFYAIGLIIVGNALFKANPSSLLSKLYGKDEAKLDGAMTMYYMAVNIGALFSTSLAPVLQTLFGYSVPFFVSGLGLAIGLVVLLFFMRVLRAIGTVADAKPFSFAKLLVLLVGIVVADVIFAWLLRHEVVSNALVFIAGFGALFLYAWYIVREHGATRKRMVLSLILLLQAVVFFVLYYQMPTSLTFFAVHNIDNHVFGLTIPPAEYQLLNPLVIILASPLLVWMYRKLPVVDHIFKFASGMTMCAVAFLLLYFTRFAGGSDALVSPLWMVGTYAFQSIGELLVSGLGLAMVASLNPSRLSGFVMGIWYIAAMVSGPIAGWFSSLSSQPSGGNLDKQASLLLYSHNFLILGLVVATIAILMWLFSPLLRKLRVEEGK